MNVNIIEKKKNPLLQREEVAFEVADAKVTPPRKELRAKIAALCNANEELTIVGKMRTFFGQHRVSGNANIYATKGAMERTEGRHMINRNLGIKGGKPKGGGEEGPAGGKEAKPAEAGAEKG